MPQTNSDLRKRFMVDGSDGRQEAEQVVIGAGGSVHKGYITYDGKSDGAWDAIQFLIEEWDYAMK